MEGLLVGSRGGDLCAACSAGGDVRHRLKPCARLLRQAAAHDPVEGREAPSAARLIAAGRRDVADWTVVRETARRPRQLVDDGAEAEDTSDRTSSACPWACSGDM